jgi:glycosyltransferase involved in cell wall biosynthesis
MARFYGIRRNRIRVIPEGVDTKVFRPIVDGNALAEWRRRVLGADVPYIVYVGKPTARRNLSQLLRAYSQLKTQHGVEHRLLLAGVALPGASPFRQAIADLHLEDEVSVAGYIEPDEMPLVYNAAAMLVYPSSYEGFGMPVLEAMACGTPAIALRNTAFPEFADGVALLLPDAHEETLVEGMLAVLTDAGLRRKMATEGPRRAARYDWRLVTRQYVDLMTELVA